MQGYGEAYRWCRHGEGLTSTDDDNRAVRGAHNHCYRDQRPRSHPPSLADTPLLVAGDGPPSADTFPAAAPAAPWEACLRGEVAHGFSLVLYEGGGVEALAGCAREHAVDAHYVPEGGEWVSHIVGAPKFVKRPFAELFAGGCPTPRRSWCAATGLVDPRGEKRVISVVLGWR